MDEGKEREEAKQAAFEGNAVVTEDERNWGMFCHVAVFAGCVVPLGNIIGPLVIWLMKKDRYPFVDYNGRQVLNFQITFLIVLLTGLLLLSVKIGLLIVLGACIVTLVSTLRAIVATSRGEYYRYPCSIQFIR